MARIPEADIQRLKDEVAVERLVEAAGVELKREGGNLAGRCPFHEDDTPSLKVTPTAARSTTGSITCRCCSASRAHCATVRPLPICPSPCSSCAEGCFARWAATA